MTDKLDLLREHLKNHLLTFEDDDDNLDYVVAVPYIIPQDLIQQDAQKEICHAMWQLLGSVGDYDRYTDSKHFKFDSENPGVILLPRNDINGYLQRLSTMESIRHVICDSSFWNEGNTDEDYDHAIIRPKQLPNQLGHYMQYRDGKSAASALMALVKEADPERMETWRFKDNAYTAPDGTIVMSLNHADRRMLIEHAIATGKIAPAPIAESATRATVHEKVQPTTGGYGVRPSEAAAPYPPPLMPGR